jgi:hypothetical protein
MTKSFWTLGSLLSACAFACGCDAPPTLERLAVTDGFAAPESAYFDSETDSWFVSNIGQSGVNGDGFISRLDVDGTTLELRFIEGLDDPKGIRVHDGVLYVADVDDLVSVSVSSPADLQRTPFPGAIFLNDVDVDRRNGDIYVSDTIGDTVYRKRGTEVSALVQGPELEAPNGLLWEPSGGLVIATFGPDLDPTTFATSAPGRLLFLDLESLEVSALSDRIGNLDGVERFGTGHIVSDFQVGLYWVDLTGDATLILDNAQEGLSSSADIGLSHEQRLVGIPDLSPQLTGTRVGFYELSWPKPHERRP